MVKAKQEDKASELEALAVKLEALQQEATKLEEARVAKSIGFSIKSARWADKQRAVRVKRVGNIVQSLKAKGLTAEQIVARLTAGQG